MHKNKGWEKMSAEEKKKLHLFLGWIVTRVTGDTWKKDKEGMIEKYCMRVSESDEAMALWLMKYHNNRPFRGG